MIKGVNVMNKDSKQIIIQCRKNVVALSIRRQGVIKIDYSRQDYKGFWRYMQIECRGLVYAQVWLNGSIIENTIV